MATSLHFKGGVTLALLISLCLHATLSMPANSAVAWSDYQVGNDVVVPSPMRGIQPSLLQSDASAVAAFARSQQPNDGDDGSDTMGDDYPLMGEPQMHRVRRVPLSLLMKRALSLFTQWRPRSSASTRFVDSGNDFVSAVARDNTRPRGQPLRWG